MDERELRRKTAHSLIEKRRRQKVQTCMDRLARLVPKNANQTYLQKLTILENTVAYIEELQQQLQRTERTQCPNTPPYSYTETSSSVSPVEEYPYYYNNYAIRYNAFEEMSRMSLPTYAQQVQEPVDGDFKVSLPPLSDITKTL